MQAKKCSKLILIYGKLSLNHNGFATIWHFAQSRTCLWVSADPRMVRNSVRYLDLTVPVDLMANRQIEDILKQRRCGPFWCSAGRPKIGVTEEAHLHCRQCGCGSPNSKPRQTKRNDAVIALFHHRMSFRVKSAPPKAGVTAVALMHTLSPLKRHISRMGE